MFSQHYLSVSFFYFHYLFPFHFLFGFLWGIFDKRPKPQNRREKGQ